MTVKQLHDITDHNTTIFIAWDGAIFELNRDNALSIEAYGRFIVERIKPMSETDIEATIKAIPATE